MAKKKRKKQEKEIKIPIVKMPMAKEQPIKAEGNIPVTDIIFTRDLKARFKTLIKGEGFKGRAYKTEMQEGRKFIIFEGLPEVRFSEDLFI